MLFFGECWCFGVLAVVLFEGGVPFGSEAFWCSWCCDGGVFLVVVMLSCLWFRVSVVAFSGGGVVLALVRSCLCFVSCFGDGAFMHSLGGALVFCFGGGAVVVF